MSSIPSLTDPLKPLYTPHLCAAKESNQTQDVIDALQLIPNIEGGYFAEIDRNPLVIDNPFLVDTTTTTIPSATTTTMTAALPLSNNDSIRNASTSIYYLLTDRNPQGHFHRNKGRIVHTVIQGRGRYVLIHADEANLGGEGEGGGGGGDTGKGGKEKGRKRIETFMVGKDVSKGERAVWVVEGGKYKASFLLGGGSKSEGGKSDGERLLISETTIPGFEYSDHDFLKLDKLKTLVTAEQVEELEWLVSKS